ncbi:hypothetical protein SLEP1_g4150 [Rubroshorea leprosula]|uniref:Uncharacterized protein n=1 Tax=Rubroshorea leprosula TaxID=152421 RepID=A0AAV5HTR0_9ROSI|nr:hypothetical protein SLEP1_g4150 [Rubroshorea leprosula]
MGDGKREEEMINDGDPLMNATAEEIEVARILLELPYLIGGGECRLWSCFTWGGRKRRTDADSDDTAGSLPRVESSSSPTTTSLPYLHRTEEEDIALPSKNVDQVSSPARPRSFSPPSRHQSEDKPKNLKKNGSSKNVCMLTILVLFFSF